MLDPSCGCATALVAAETLNRKWIGIDLSTLAVKLVLRDSEKPLTLERCFKAGNAGRSPSHGHPEAHGRWGAAAVQDAPTHALGQAGG